MRVLEGTEEDFNVSFNGSTKASTRLLVFEPNSDACSFSIDTGVVILSDVKSGHISSLIDCPLYRSITNFNGRWSLLLGLHSLEISWLVPVVVSTSSSSIKKASINDGLTKT